MQTFGRTTITANYTEEELLGENTDAKVLDILLNSIEIHEHNKAESRYLIDYLYGDQDIKDKVKLTRTEINNKGVENWAWAFMDWKKAFLLGKPIQYAPIDDQANEEISKLNNYCIYEDKDQKDQDLYEDIFTCGRAFRFANYSGINEDDEAPFDLVNYDVLNTEVVYSSSPKHEQLLSYVVTSKKYITQQLNPITGKTEYNNNYYNEYTVYTRNTKYVINDKQGLKIVPQEVNGKEVLRVPILQNVHLITEYYFNRKRMSFLEICKDIFDDLNYIENLDKDDIEAFVNSIMVFTNAEVDEKGMDAIKKFGAVSIKSTDQKKASVELLQSRLKSLDTQMDFDMSLAIKKSNENPVYYIEYANARICSILKKYKSNTNDLENIKEFITIDNETAYNILNKLYEYKDVILSAGKKKQPHLIAKYCYDLASLFHSYYGQEKMITEDETYTKERIALLNAIKIVLNNALDLIGILPREEM